MQQLFQWNMTWKVGLCFVSRGLHKWGGGGLVYVTPKYQSPVIGMP